MVSCGGDILRLGRHIACPSVVAGASGGNSSRRVFSRCGLMDSARTWDGAGFLLNVCIHKWRIV